MDATVRTRMEPRAKRLVLSAFVGVLLPASVASVPACSGVFVSSQPQAGEDSAAPDASVTQSDTSIEGLSGCARYGSPTFCVDFESPGALSTTWTSSDAVGSSRGTIVLSGANVVSPRNAAFFDLTKPSGDCTYLQLERGFPGNYRGFSFRADYRAETEGFFTSFVVEPRAKLFYNFLFRVAPLKVSVSIQRYEELPDAAERYAFVAGTDIPLVVDSRGRYVAVEVELLPGSANATLVVDGVRAPFTMPSDLTVTNPKLAVGPYCSPGTQRVTVDDVVLRLTP